MSDPSESRPLACILYDAYWTEHRRLERAVLDAKIALAEFEYDEAVRAFTAAQTSCSCDPDTQTWDPNCAVSNTSSHVERTAAHLKFLRACAETP